MTNCYGKMGVGVFYVSYLAPKIGRNRAIPCAPDGHSQAFLLAT